LKILRIIMGTKKKVARARGGGERGCLCSKDFLRNNKKETSKREGVAPGLRQKIKKREVCKRKGSPLKKRGQFERERKSKNVTSGVRKQKPRVLTNTRTKVKKALFYNETWPSGTKGRVSNYSLPKKKAAGTLGKQEEKRVLWRKKKQHQLLRKGVNPRGFPPS